MLFLSQSCTDSLTTPAPQPLQHCSWFVALYNDRHKEESKSSAITYDWCMLPHTKPGSGYHRYCENTLCTLAGPG